MIVIEPSFRKLRRKEDNYRKSAFVLTSPMVYWWDDSGYLLRVPVGTITDFASIPPVFRAIFNNSGCSVLPAVVHDYLYSYVEQEITAYMADVDMTRPAGHRVRNEIAVRVKVSRKRADQLFYKMLIVEGMRRRKARMMYRAVRLFGGMHLALGKRKREKKKANARRSRMPVSFRPRGRR